MTEKAILAFVARALEKVNLDAVLTGNAGAALHGLRVTMIALDFLIRRTPANVRKLEALAIDIDGDLFRSWYPTRGLYQVSRNLDLLQLNFTTAAEKSFEGVRSRSTPISGFRVAALTDIAVSGDGLIEAPVGAAIEAPMARKARTKKRPGQPSRAVVLAALEKESERLRTEQIRDLMAKPVEQRMNFLRKKIGLTATAL